MKYVANKYSVRHESDKCRCKGNVICNNCWTEKHTIQYEYQQRNKKNFN